MGREEPRGAARSSSGPGHHAVGRGEAEAGCGEVGAEEAHAVVAADSRGGDAPSLASQQHRDHRPAVGEQRREQARTQRAGGA